jgi:hypothetical protein
MPKVARSDLWYLSRIFAQSKKSENSRVEPTAILYDRWHESALSSSPLISLPCPSNVVCIRTILVAESSARGKGWQNAGFYCLKYGHRAGIVQARLFLGEFVVLSGEAGTIFLPTEPAMGFQCPVVKNGFGFNRRNTLNSENNLVSWRERCR